jgi:hypothetical protein
MEHIFFTLRDQSLTCFGRFDSVSEASVNRINNEQGIYLEKTCSTLPPGKVEDIDGQLYVQFHNGKFPIDNFGNYVK